MSPETPKLVGMANQIAGFFRTQPGNDAERAGQVAGHLRDYWAPEMRAALKAHAQHDDRALDDLVRRALPLI